MSFDYSHFWFNVFGLLTLIPLRPVRREIVSTAKWLGESAEYTRIFPYVYVVALTLIYPLFFLAIIEGLYADTVIAVVVSLLVVACSGIHLVIWFMLKKQKPLEPLELGFERSDSFEGERIIDEHLEHGKSRRSTMLSALANHTHSTMSLPHSTLTHKKISL